MPAPKPAERRQASKDALKAIYFVVLGIAFTEALEGAFLEHGEFVGDKLFEADRLTAVLLLLAFLPTAVRFAHGASIHMDVMHEQAYKPVLDFIGFIVQASLLYLMAETLNRPRTFALLFALLLVFDSGWLVMLRWRRYLVFGGTEWQWMTTNGTLLVVLAVAYLLARWIGWGSAAIVMVAATAATITDYVMNREFYFPRAELEHDHEPYITTGGASRAT